MKVKAEIVKTLRPVSTREQRWQSGSDPYWMLTQQSQVAPFCCACQKMFDGKYSPEYLEANVTDGQSDSWLMTPRQLAYHWTGFCCCPNPLHQSPGPAELLPYAGIDDRDGALRAHFLRDLFGNPFDCCYRLSQGKLCARSLAHHGLSIQPTEYLDPVPWMTDRVRALALAASRPTRPAHGHDAGADGTLNADALSVLADGLEDAMSDARYPTGRGCERCNGKGLVAAVAGLPDQDLPDEPGMPVKRQRITCPDCIGKGIILDPLLAHLRSAGPHIAGCWPIDLFLGKS